MVGWRTDCMDCVRGKSGVSRETTAGIHPMLFYRWSTVCDAGPTLKRHCLSSPCRSGTVTAPDRVSPLPPSPLLLPTPARTLTDTSQAI